MGLFSGIASAIKGTFSAVSNIATGVLSAAAPLVAAVAPFAGPLAGAFLASRLPGLAGVSAINPSPPIGTGLAGQRGVSAIVQSGFQNPSCTPGVMGAGGFNNPIAQAALFPGFNPHALPARPMFGQFQQQAAFNPPPQFQQTTSFSTPNFGQSVAPSFRPFTPSFRSGMPSPGIGFQPGISQGFGFQPQFQQQQFQPQFQQQNFFGFGSF